jgi:hypothetical protein
MPDCLMLQGRIRRFRRLRTRYAELGLVSCVMYLALRLIPACSWASPQGNRPNVSVTYEPSMLCPIPHVKRVMLYINRQNNIFSVPYKHYMIQ